MNTSEAQFNVVSPEELARQRKDLPHTTERAVVLDTGTVQIDLNRRPSAFKGRQLGGVAARAALRIDRPAFKGELTRSEGMAGFPEADTLTAPLPSSSGSLPRKPGGPLWGLEKLAHKAAVDSGNELPLEVDGVVLMTHKEPGADVK
jgi:hypothetical protein